MCRPAQNDGLGAQTNPTPDLTLTLTLWGGSRGSRFAREFGRGAVLNFRANLKNLGHTCK